jgi:hypothetical protein
MIDPDCSICFGIGWVCDCQRANGLEEPDVTHVITDEVPRHH